jgi:hypothetical protein
LNIKGEKKERAKIEKKGKSDARSCQGVMTLWF